MRAFLRSALVLATVTLSAASLSEAQKELTKPDRQGPVTVSHRHTHRPGGDRRPGQGQGGARHAFGRP